MNTKHIILKIKIHHLIQRAVVICGMLSPSLGLFHACGSIEESRHFTDEKKSHFTLALVSKEYHLVLKNLTAEKIADINNGGPLTIEAVVKPEEDDPSFQSILSTQRRTETFFLRKIEDRLVIAKTTAEIKVQAGGGAVLSLGDHFPTITMTKVSENEVMMNDDNVAVEVGYSNIYLLTLPDTLKLVAFGSKEDTYNHKIGIMLESSPVTIPSSLLCKSTDPHCETPELYFACDEASMKDPDSHCLPLKQSHEAKGFEILEKPERDDISPRETIYFTFKFPLLADDDKEEFCNDLVSYLPVNPNPTNPTRHPGCQVTKLDELPSNVQDKFEDDPDAHKFALCRVGITVVETTEASKLGCDIRVIPSNASFGGTVRIGLSHFNP